MKKSTIESVNELTELMGRDSWQRTSRACTGKWRGTTDYSIIFENGLRLFISNGMKYFELHVRNYIDGINTVKSLRQKYIEILQEQVLKDNEIAISEGLSPVEVIDVDIEMECQLHCMWAYVLLEVCGKQLKDITTCLSYSMCNNTLEKWIKELDETTIFTAGAVSNPDYIFGNVRFSSIDELYKII